MLEFKDFKVESKKNSPLISIKFNFIDEKLSEESVEYITEKLNEYETYLEYDCKSEFLVKYKKKATIEMKIIFPGRKVPEDKKELEKFINRYVMDLNEYYYKINNLNHTYEDDLVEPI